MNELLSPAGTIEAFHAAISNGANAIYLGLDKFSARAYANNFTLESLKELLDFAHLRNVKIYVTINTIVYDDELNEVYKTIDELAKMGVDGIIVQDLAVANYITSTYKSLHAHASTQMGVDDLDAAKLLKELGFTRIVFARETPLVDIKKIKEELQIEVEAFIHGALCVSYSGNCYMSSAIGERSGNRGRCAGCCRKHYSLINLDNGETLKDGYLLSMKDLNVANKISDMSFVDSLKIEGRMKEPNYVASVTRTYRELLDHKHVDLSNLDKVFNRTYTSGFMNGSTSEDITNIEKPNNYGYLIGTIIKEFRNTIWIRLNKSLSKGDQIRIENFASDKEISVPVLKLFDNNFKELTTCEKIAVVSCKEKVKVGAKVYKTKDAEFVNEADRSLLNKEYKKIPIEIEFIGHVDKPVILKVSYDKNIVFVKSNELIQKSINQPTTKDNVIKQLSKLNDTPYEIGHISIELDDDCFISLKLINELRREAIEKLNKQRLDFNVSLCEISSVVEPIMHIMHEPEITVEVSNDAQYEVAKKLGIKHIYYKNVIRRNNVKYPELEGEVLVNGYGGIKHYQGKNTIVSDSSLNVVNHKTAAMLSTLGVDRVTLSQEISRGRILSLIDNYTKIYYTHPNLELIVYGRSKIMHSKYCPLKRTGHCGECKHSSFALKDDFASFPILFNKDCTINLLNSKPLNLMDCLDDVKGINYYRLVFTIETPEEVERIVNYFKGRLANVDQAPLFKSNEYTKGHFFTDPL